MTEVQIFFVWCFMFCSPIICIILFSIFNIIHEFNKKCGVDKIITLCNNIMKVKEEDYMGEYDLGLMDGRQEIAEEVLKMFNERTRR